MYFYSNKVNVPVLPSTISRLLEIDNGLDGSKDIAEIIESDPGMCASVLKLANSALYARGQEVESVERACVLLGVEIVKAMALASYLCKNLFKGGRYREEHEKLCKRSLIGATASHIIHDSQVKKGLMRKQDRGLVFTSSILRDIALIFIHSQDPKLYYHIKDYTTEKVLKKKNTSTSTALINAERELMRTDHQKMGADILRRWMLPEEVCIVIENHHSFTSIKDTRLRRVAATVFMGDLIGRIYCPEYESPTEVFSMVKMVGKRMGLSADSIGEIVDSSAEHVETIMEIMNLSGHIEPYTDMVTRVAEKVSKQNIQLAEIILQLREEVRRNRELVAMFLRSRDHYKELAYKDYLTMTYNHRYMHEYLRELDHNNTPYGFMLIDIDNFKSINDTYGHKTGDVALVHTAQVIRSVLPVDAKLCRYGGDEFAVIVPNADEHRLLSIGEDIIAQLEMSPLMLNSKVRVRIRVSVGVAVLEEDKNKTMENADLALRFAKSSGKNRCLPYSSVMPTSSFLSEPESLCRAPH